MSFSINNLLCVGCGDCTRACMNAAIQESELAYFIAPERCINCGACKKICIKNAIACT